MERIGLIAGNGLFPVEFAREARGRGLYVAAVAHEGETREEIEEVVDSLVCIKVGQIGRMIRSLQDQGVRRAVMAGGIDKPRTLSTFRPDLRAARLLARARGLGRGMGDDTLLGALADELAGAGIEIVPSTLFLAYSLTPLESPLPEHEDEGVALFLTLLDSPGSIPKDMLPGDLAFGLGERKYMGP